MIQLNNKTGYSFFYSALKCSDLVNISLESKSSYVAINDIRNMFGYLELEKLATKHNLTPLYLVEFIVLYMDNDLTFSLLCQNDNSFGKRVRAGTKPQASKTHPAQKEGFP